MQSSIYVHHTLYTKLLADIQHQYVEFRVLLPHPFNMQAAWDHLTPRLGQPTQRHASFFADSLSSFSLAFLAMFSLCLVPRLTSRRRLAPGSGAFGCAR